MRRTGRTRKLQRALALILSASLVLDPQTVAAMETDGAAAQEVSADDPQEAVWQEESLPDVQDLSETAGGDSSEDEAVWPVEEVESYRQANEKQYRMSDGSMEVRIYPEAVHYEQDGVWLDIDNTLYATEDGTYENGANSYQAVFSDGSGEQEDLVTYREGEYEISWKMVQEQNEPGTDEVDAEDPDEDPDENQASEEQEKEALDDGGNSEAQEDSDEEETSEVQETPDAEFEEEKEQSEKADEAETDEAISEDEEEASEDQKTPTEEETSEEATTDEEITDEDTEPAQDDPLIPVWPEETSLSEEGTLLTYSGMEEGINLTYEARPASLKESILVEGPQEDYRYQFLLTLKGLSAELTESGDVELSDGGQVQYRIPAPYMEDAEGNTSWDAGYTLEEQEDGTCLLTVEADRDWMEEAAWPVLIDPVLEKEKKAGVTDFVTVRSDGQSEKSHKVGMDKEIIYRTYLRFDLPELPRGAVISKAVLDTGGGTMKVKTFQVPGDCAWEKEDPDGEDTITWENQPFKPGEPVTGRTLDYATPDSDFVITRAVREWYAGKANHGIVFLSMDETKSGTVLVSLPTSSAYLKLTYRAQGGLTSYWSTHDFAAGAAGEGHIRDFNGGLTLLTEDVSSEGLRMPLSLSHVYQSELAGTEDPLVRTDPYTRCGDGWKLSVMQTLEIPYRETDLDDYAYVYTDSDGSRHYFKRGNATYLLNGAAKNVSGGTGASYPSASDEDGLGLFVVPVTEAKLKETYPWKIVNKSGSSSLYFDRAGRLGMVTDANQKENGANASTKEQNRILYTYEAVENGDRGGQAKLEVFRDALADLKADCKNENWQELLTEASTQAADLKENCPLLGTNYKAARQFLVAEQNIKYLVDTPTAAVSVRTSKTTAAVNAFALVLTELEGAGEVYDQRLVRIEDAVGKATTLAYNEDGLLASVTEPSDETVRMQYQYDAEGRLTEILDSREQAPSAYSYTEQGLLSRITDPDGYQISLEWEEDRVSSLEESVPEGDGRSSGQAYTIQHGTDGTVHYRFSGPDDIPGTEDDIENVYSFDEAGKTLSVYSTPVSGTEIIGASVYTYTDGTTEGPNKIKESAQTGRSAVNLLQNHSFEYKDDTWTLEPGTGAKDSLSAYSTKTHYIGKHAAMFSFLAASGTTERSMAIREDRSLSAGTYTISGYLKTDKLEGNLGLAVRRADGETWKTETVGDTTDVQMNNGWQRVQTAFTLEEDAEVEIRIEVTGISGNAWADCLQLEEGILANPYNILEDGSFELSEDIPYQSDSKPSSTDKKHIQNEVTDSISTDGHHSYHITAEAASTKSFSFLTEVGSESSSYILSGWYKSTLTPERNEKDTENGRYLMASAYYHGTDTADSVPGDRPGRLQQFYWLPSWPDGWTYFSFPLAQGAWNELRLTIKVQGLEGDLYLDGMQLVKNEVQTRKYTNTGKLTSRTVQAKTSTYTYDYERLKTEKTPGGNVSTYTYDNISSDVKQVTRSVGPGNYYTYDQYGNTVSESVYKSGPELYTRTFYTEDGNFRTGIADTRGNESKTEYDPNTGLLLSQTDPNGNKTAYTYNEKQLLTRTSHTDADGTSTENDYLYDGEDRLTGITHNGFSYQFQYDSFGNSIGTGITGTDGEVYPLISNTYQTGNGKLLKTAYANGYTEEPVYNRLEQKTGEIRDGEEAVRYEYDTRGRLGRTTDLENSKSTVYAYDTSDRLTGLTYRDTQTGEILNRIQYMYDSAGRVAQASAGTQGEVRTDIYTYEVDDLPQKAVFASGDRVTWTYDTLRRQTQTLYAGASNTAAANKLYVLTTYEDGVSSNTKRKGSTTLISSWTNRLGTKNIQTQDTYTYDSLGNITSITDKDGKQRRYTYDQRNQLIREEDEASGRTVSYTYDHGGNLLRAEISEKNGTSAYTDTYTYDTIWTDKLTGYNGQAITYDASGNPLEYLGNTFTWKDGRKLESITKPDGSVITYTYDSEGNRIGKQIRKADGTEEKTTYYWDGGKLLREVSGDETLYYSYDSNGKLWSMDWEKGDTKKGYFVIRNAQGDITGLYHREDSSLAGSYTYDAWGQLLSVNPANESDEEILRKNPFRYRGYYYDEESGYYFLQSRYYNPEVRRFLNADTLVAETGNGVGYNLFAYSSNQPVNYKDESGHVLDTVMDVVSIGMDVVDIAQNPTDPINWICLGVDVVCAALPAVTAGGAMVRAAGKAGDAVDAVADTAKAVDHVEDAVKSGASSVEGFIEWLNKGGMDNKVYFGVKGGDAQYTGITKQCIESRLMQHNNAGKGFDELRIQFDNLTRNQARAIEQYFIENGPNELNKINSIGQNNKYYNDAMNWAKSFLGK